MITRNEIVALFEKLASKDITFGSLLKFKEDTCTYGMIKFEAGDVVRYAGFTNKYGTWIAPLENQSPSFEPFQVKERMEKFKIIGHDIYLHHVLEKWSPLWTDKGLATLLTTWRNCGLTKSLQQIVEESGWEGIRFKAPGKGLEPDAFSETERLRSKEAENLFLFLKELFL